MENKEKKEQKQEEKEEEKQEKENEKIKNIESTDDEISYDENDGEYDDDDDDDESEHDDEIDESSDSDTANEKEILKSIIYLSQLKKKKKEKEKNEFLPSLKKFYKSSMTKRHKLYNNKIRKKLCFLAKSILAKKIPVDYSHKYGYVLKMLVKKKMHSDDVKIALCEDNCLRGIFFKAIKKIEESQKNVKSK